MKQIVFSIFCILQALECASIKEPITSSEIRNIIVSSSISFSRKMHILSSFIKEDSTVAGRLLLPLARYGNTHLIRATILSKSFINATYTCPLEQQKELLKRLILTGNKDNLALYLEHSLVRTFAIDDDIVSYAKQRAEISQGTYSIYNRLCDLQKTHSGVRKRKHQSIETADQEQCPVCFLDTKVTASNKECENKHAMHEDCFKKMLKSGLVDCPVCKGAFALTDKESKKMSKYVKRRQDEQFEQDTRDLLEILSPEERAYQQIMLGGNIESRLVPYHNSDSEEDIDLDFGS